MTTRKKKAKRQSLKVRCNKGGGSCKGTHPLICDLHGCAYEEPEKKKPNELRDSLMEAIKIWSTGEMSEFAKGVIYGLRHAQDLNALIKTQQSPRP